MEKAHIGTEGSQETSAVMKPLGRARYLMSLHTTFPDCAETMDHGKFDRGDIVLYNGADTSALGKGIRNRPGIVLRKWLMPGQTTHYEVLWGTRKIRMSEGVLDPI